MRPLPGDEVADQGRLLGEEREDVVEADEPHQLASAGDDRKPPAAVGLQEAERHLPAVERPEAAMTVNTGETPAPMPEPLERLARLLRGRRPRRAAVRATEAAVTLVLRPAAAGRLEFLAIRRAECPGDPWSGHVALPGGRRDPADPDIWATAVRETREEVGLDLERSGTLLGRLDDVQPSTDRLPAIVITPFVVVVPPDVETHTSAEVASRMWLPAGIIGATEHRTRVRLAAAGGREVPAIAYGGHVIWGLTLRILTQVAPLLDEAVASG